ncbi:DsbE family thiol:disulfide interchange protein [Ferrimonas sp. YFM]|uniref:DsbE family thiol:disulfide interchange protein n=1 Tax=Ferrimonas sp. YFM TaxID=3028878 RepID=UPI002573F449|nr:DsbE family thiol:disulfide interchange protein [Ferrimonas sp. YFM]BDY03228.1 thiol:disulfide interchange protein [Ferrimonas sp. YFM]
MKRALLFIPLLIFIGMAVFLYKGLFLNPKELDSALEGKPVPTFTLESLEDAQVTITNKDLEGEVYLLNVWATWCPSCKYEHPFLNKLSRQGAIPIYGINYRDERGLALRYLANSGDPYTKNLYDPEGKLGLDLGVYGAPETFVVDHNGVVRYRFAGVLGPQNWAETFMPMISELRREAAAAKGGA